MLVDALLQHEVEGRVDRLVEEVEELESKQAELVDELVIKVVEELTEDDRNVNVGNGRNGCSYKDFVACKPKEFNGKGGANSEVRTRGREAEVGMNWEDFKTLMKEEYCPSNKMQRLETEFWNHAMVRADYSAYTDRFHELARIVAATEPLTIQSAILKARVLTDKAVRNGSLNRNSGESSRERNVKGDNMRARTRKTFATITNPVRKEYTGSAPTWRGPRMVNPLNARNPTTTRGACYECGGTDHYKSACPRLNRAPG
ncbi:reverse transcriptase domain-containing protein [Tanacetum coccineum]